MVDKNAYISQLEERLRTLEEIIKLLPGHVYWKDRNSVIRGCNQQQAEHAGLKSPKEIIGLTAKDLVSKNLPLEKQAKDIAAIEAADKAVMESDKTMVFEEIQYLPKNNIYYLSTKAPLHDVIGNVTGIVGISINITEQKKAEAREREALAEATAAKEQAKAAEELHVLKSVIAMMPGHVYWKNKDSVFRGCNQQHAKHFGLKSTESIIGLTARNLVAKDLSPEEQEKEIAAVETADRTVMESDQVIVIEETNYLPQGNVYYLSTKAPLHDTAGNVIGIAGVSIDITEQKTAEAREREALVETAAAKEHAKAETELRQAVMVLAGSIAHDMRTPLAIVRMLGEVIGNVTPPLVQTYELAQQANLPNIPDINTRQFKKLPDISTNLGNIVTEMNDYINITLKSLSKVLTKDLNPEDLEKCSADYCISKALSSYPFEDGERDLIHTDSTYQFEFMGNQILLFRVLSNLIKNALYQIHYKNNGEIFISTRTNNTYNQIVVKDTAGGVNSTIVDNLFDGYQTTKQQGTGVGLAFCKLTMESFRGTISCHSVESDFIEFVLSFPKLVA